MIDNTEIKEKGGGHTRINGDWLSGGFLQREIHICITPDGVDDTINTFLGFSCCTHINAEGQDLFQS